MDDINSFATDAFDEAIAAYTVGIVGARSGQLGAGIGTGAAVLWNERALILTAWHVIQESQPECIWFFFRPKGTLIRQITARRPRASAPADRYLRESVSIMNIAEASDIDLAAIEVPHSISVQYPIQFYDLKAQRATAGIGTSVLLGATPALCSAGGRQL